MPTAITEHAVRLLRAGREAKQIPAPPPIANPLEIENAADYAGTFSAPNGHKLVFAADAKRLSLQDGDRTVPLQRTHGDNFISTVAGAFTEHTFLFARTSATEPSSGAMEKKPEAPVVEVSYGPETYFTSGYAGPRSFANPEQALLYAGRYHSDSPWGGDVLVYAVKGKLVLEGEPLTPIGGALFRVGDEDWSPETAEFVHFHGGKAQLLKFGGMDFFRVEVD